jgi:8-oxo-dGTP diphosphatase
MEDRRTVRVAAAIIIKEGRVLATQRGYGDYKDWWEFPGGKLEPGESPAQAAEREIREELDAEIRAGDIICTVEYDYPRFHLYMYCIRCELISAGIKLLEHESAKWLDRDELDSVRWLPSDITVIDELRKIL